MNFMNGAKALPYLDRFVWMNLNRLMNPIHAEVDLTAACNCKCVWCMDKDYRSRYKKGNLSPQEWVRMLDQTGVLAVSFRGGGEPTIYRGFDDLVHEISYLHLGLITNGIRTLKPEVVASFDWIRVSLDCTNAESYLKLKKVDKFDQVVENISNMATLTKVGISFLVHSELNEMEAKKIGDKTKVDYVQFKCMDGKVSSFASDSEDEPSNAGLPCYAHLLIVHIAPNGDLYPCCGLKYTTKPYGNLASHNFEDIWRSKAHQNLTFRLSTVEGTKRCPACRMLRYNWMLNEAVQTYDKVKDEYFI